MCSPSIVSESERNRIAALNARFRKSQRARSARTTRSACSNLMTSESMARVMSEIDAHKVFDLSVDYFNAMPSWTAGGEPTCQISVIRTPNGNIVDDYGGAGRAQNELVASCGETISMYTHCGTHIDTLCHFGYHGTMWNGFTAVEHLGSRGWNVLGAEKQPPIVARGSARRRRRERPGGTPKRLRHREGRPPRVPREPAERGQGGRCRCDSHRRASGLAGNGRVSRHASRPEPRGRRVLACAGAMVIGADTIGLEQGNSADPENATPVHTYLFAEAGVLIMEVLDLEETRRRWRA